MMCVWDTWAGSRVVWGVNSSWVYGECQSALAEFGCVGFWFVARSSYVIVVLVGWFTGVVSCYVMLGWLLD